MQGLTCCCGHVCRFRSPRMTLRPLGLAAQKKWFAMSTTSSTPAATKCPCCISEPAFWVRPAQTPCAGCRRCWKFCIRLRKRCNKKLRGEAAHQRIFSALDSELQDCGGDDIISAWSLAPGILPVVDWNCWSFFLFFPEMTSVAGLNWAGQSVDITTVLEPQFEPQGWGLNVTFKCVLFSV